MNYLASWLYPASTNFSKHEYVTFFIHDEEHLVNVTELDPKTTLNQYLRSVAHLTGTKNMCLEGGCGCCVVTVSFPDPLTKRETIIAVNSCLVLIYSCAGWKIYTADGLGNTESGYHPIQNAMVKFNGTQCGYCTSGMIMNMYALYESKDNLSMEEVENSFGGNICRCTGYRPILTAFKSLASDASSDIIGTFSDIEDIPEAVERNKNVQFRKEPKTLEPRNLCTAEYFMDIPDRPDQLYAAFVLTKAPANSIIQNVDTSKALSLDGVKAYYDKNDIPGENTFTPFKAGLSLSVAEELFCSGTVRYYYQPIGIVVATSQHIALTAADLVEITYLPGKDKPLLSIKDLIKNNATSKIKPEVQVEAKTKGNDVKHLIKGDFNIGWQYHYHMETQCCVAVPNENGLTLYASTQHMNFTQVSAAKLLNIGVNKVNVVVRRLGGSYGAKSMRSGMISCSAALAAHKLQKSVKFSMSLESNMNVIGGRFPFYGSYEVGVNNDGVIQYLDASAYTDFGNNGGNENVSSIILNNLTKAYKSDTFTIKVYSTRTDNHTGTTCRAPGNLEATAYIENIMQHIAVSINKDPITVRLNNITNDEVKKFLNEVVDWANVRVREKVIEKFNKENRWVKKGLAVSPILFPLTFYGTYHVYVSIFQGDGTVGITHGGIEMGQGINTKVAQVCAYALKIPLSLVTVNPSQSVVCPNNIVSGGSIASESVCLATLKACEILNERMKPVRDTMAEPIDWPDLVYQCFMRNINLCGSFMFDPTVKPIEPYPIYAAACVETEVDILTGLRQIKRVDIVEDTGDSLSPNIDIGQIEGGFIMGLGYWTCEKHVFDSVGKLLTNRTWNYKVPGAKDIPADFRVKLPKRNPNAVGVLNSKATAEPPTCLAIAVALSIKNAVEHARVESSIEAEKWYPIDGPCTVENTFLNSLNDYHQYTL